MTVGVWGYGREGRAAVDWLLRTTAESIVVFDDRPSAFGADSARVRFTADFGELTARHRCLVSPGVPHTDRRRVDLVSGRRRRSRPAPSSGCAPTTTARSG